MSLKVKVRPLRRVDIDTEYCQWYENSDGHLDFFTGSGRKFTREVLIDDYEEGKSSGRWYYYIIETLSSERVGNIKIGPIDLVNRTSDLVCLIGNRNFLGQGLGVKAIKLGNKVAFGRRTEYSKAAWGNDNKQRAFDKGVHKGRLDD